MVVKKFKKHNKSKLKIECCKKLKNVKPKKPSVEYF